MSRQVQALTGEGLSKALYGHCPSSPPPSLPLQQRPLRQAKVSFSPSPAANGLRLTSMTGDNQPVYSATGPSYFTITNGPSAIVGLVTGTITVAQSSNYLQQPKRVGVKTVEASTAYPKFTTSRDVKANPGTTTFSCPSGVQASSSLTLSITFGYQTDSSWTPITPTATATPITYTATVSLADSRGEQIGQTASASLSTNFFPTT